MKTQSLRSNSVTREVNLNRTKIDGKMLIWKNSNATFWVSFKECDMTTKKDSLTRFAHSSMNLRRGARMSQKEQHLHICKVNGNLVAIIYKRSEMALCKWAFIIIDEHLSTMRDADEENVNENLMTCLPFKIALNGPITQCRKTAIRLPF